MGIPADSGSTLKGSLNRWDLSVKLLFEASAPVNADPIAVEHLIDDGWMLRRFLAGDESSTTAEDAAKYVDVDYSPRAVGFQGHWWYRGEISVTRNPTTLHYRVFNIAGRSAWAVPLANRLFIGYAATVQHGVDDLAQAVERHLSEDASQTD